MSEEKITDDKEKTFEEIANQLASGDSEIEIKSEEQSLDPSSDDAGDPSAENSENSAEDEYEFKPKIAKEEPIDYSLQGELKRIFARPLYIAALVLGVLMILLFLLIALQMREDQDVLALEGYVRVNHHLPKDYKGKISPTVKELLKIYKQKEHSLKEKLTLIKDDPREDLPVLGDQYPSPLTNKELIPILQKQKIGKVDLGGTEKTELMNLSGLDLTKLDYKFFFKFIGSDLRYTDFSAIKAEELEFRGASMQYSQLVDAEIPRSNFSRARISFANLYNAKLDNSIFIGVLAEQTHFSDSSLIQTNFTEAIVFDSDFEGVIANDMNASQAHFEGVSFRDSILVGANFKNSVLRAVNFANCDLRGANFENTDLEGSNFEGADIEGANFKNALVTSTNFKDVKNASYEQLNQVDFLPAAINIPKELLPKKDNWESRITPPRRT